MEVSRIGVCDIQAPGSAFVVATRISARPGFAELKAPAVRPVIVAPTSMRPVVIPMIGLSPRLVRVTSSTTTRWGAVAESDEEATINSVTAFFDPAASDLTSPVVTRKPPL